MNVSISRFDVGFLILFLLGGVLLLTNLGNGRLWQDEAETAVLGRAVLQKGYPCAFDGVNRLNPGLPVQKGDAWTYHSWFPMYLTAGSFWLFGINTTAARLPFALLGWASIWLGYRLAKRWTKDLLVARLTALGLVTSVPFLLHMRQCRYYAPALFFTLWVAWATHRFLHGRRGSMGELILAFLFLFHSDHGVFLPVALACVLHFLSSRPTPVQVHRAWVVAGMVLALTVPWMIYLKSWQHHRIFSWREVKRHLEFYIRQTNKYLVPLGFWLLVILVGRPGVKALFGEKETPVRETWRFVTFLLTVGLAFLILIPEQRHFRYLIFLVPFLLMGQAALLAWIFRRRWVIGFGLTILLIFTDLIPYSGLSLLAAQIPLIKARLSSPEVKVRSLPWEFLGELTHPYRGPIDGIVEYLSLHARPGEAVKTPPAEDHPLLFYTSLVVEPLSSLEEFEKETFPEWIVIRRHWVSPSFFQSRYYRQIQSRYEEVRLDVPDIPWQNRPDPGYHRFRTDRDAPPVVLFHRVR